MKSTDKFLLGIVIGIVLLVVAAFTVALVRPKASYLPGNTPEAVTNNYLLALRQGDYTRAYGYLSPFIKGYPVSAEVFTRNVQDNSRNFRLNEADVSLEVTDVQVTGDSATATVRETRFQQGGLINNGQTTSTFKVQLRRNLLDNNWYVYNSSFYYWALCWNNQGGCK